MQHGYGFQRPESQQKVWKRPRRRIVQNLTNDTTTYAFTYKCYDCNQPYEISLGDNSEIECKYCNSRVIRKESSKKPHVLDAV